MRGNRINAVIPRMRLDCDSAADDQGAMSRSKCLCQPRSALDVGEFGFAGVGRVRAGVEPAEVTVESGLGWSLAGAVGHHQWRVEGDQVIAGHVRPQSG